ncbi:rifin PIR protein, putative [Plasmodium reichenowi]|uniref:Rifin PIR protein, putative n=1 Tax=Plasmodium reichenowi TaxID=5854 RepID=A0A2P9DSV0_PLARE|nr:rifin PIR protein, putative [Plasmodium reichenowi]
MKVHYINILLFALPLDILVSYPHKKTSITKRHTQPNRSLCECELYAPVNYGNDPQMKKIMENFNKQTQQRFHEYDDCMQEKRRRCKDKCDKEIQKIILKDKLEKQMEEQLTTLETKIDTNDIPTCVCEKSMADKMEKDCLRCGYGLGTVAPTVGLLGTVAVGAWKNTKIAAAIKAAEKAGAAAGKIAGESKGMEVVIDFLEQSVVKDLLPGIWEKISNIDHFSEVTKFAVDIYTQKKTVCSLADTSNGNGPMCHKFEIGFDLKDLITGDPKGAPNATPIKEMLEKVVAGAEQAAANETANVTASKTAAAIETNTGVVQTAIYDWYATIGYSVLTIIITVLIMVIIYKILRYRRKKKMKKKLQYIKLLEE